jgi:hypothetical protein
MNVSLKEQLEALYGCRNTAVHNKDVTFSRCFMAAAEQYDLDLDELRKLLGRGMRPGKAIRRLLNAALKANAQQWADRQEMRGKERTQYIEKYIYCRLDEDVQSLTEAYNASEHAQDVQFADTPEEIAFVYQNGPRSCMIDEFASQMAGLAYGFAEHLAIAYLRIGDRITTRTLVNVATRKFGRVYGDEGAKLHNGLEELGYRWTYEDYSPAEGERLFVPTVMKRTIEPFGQSRMCSLHPPYVDWAEHLVESTRWEWKKAFGKKFYGCWMRVTGEFYSLLLDEMPKVWEFHSHAAPATLVNMEWQYVEIEPEWTDYNR